MKTEVLAGVAGAVVGVSFIIWVVAGGPVMATIDVALLAFGYRELANSFLSMILSYLLVCLAVSIMAGKLIKSGHIRLY